MNNPKIKKIDPSQIRYTPEEGKKLLLEKHTPETAEEKRKLLVKYGYIKL